MNTDTNAGRPAKPETIEDENLSPKEKARLLPDSPGVYRFYDKNGTIIYIGKAKNLKKRVSQYFRKKDALTVKTRAMVSKIADIKHTVVESEEDAFLLENNLIKENQPKYNILLKDGKTYPWIIIKNEHFPRIFTGRRFVRDGSLYFGPYSSAFHAKHLVEIINSLYRLRSCKLKLNPEEIEKGKYKVCLDYHIKKCYGPCIGAYDEQSYDRQIEEIKRLLGGETSSLIKEYRAKMKEAAANLEFEYAHELKTKVDILENHYSKSLIVHPSINDVDVFSLIRDGDDVFGNFLRIKGGCIIQSLNMEFRIRNDEESETDVMGMFIGEIYSSTGKLSGEILVSHMPEERIGGKNMHIPFKGDKADLLKLSIKNANAYKFEKLKHEEIIDPEEHTRKILDKMQKDLQLKRRPVWMECFDNSNIQGTNPVASCVVFKDGKPSKKDYRHFNIKTVIGANDFASMNEILERRYSRLLEEGNGLPQLIVIDGGKGQVGAACQALIRLGIMDKVEVIGLAKRLEEIIVPGKQDSLLLDKNSSTLRVLMHIRNEAHRFGITFHRDKRSKSQIDSELRSIPGIGEATEMKLLNAFKSVRRIKQASEEELAKVAGRSIAKKIKSALSD